jgi:hypothetical protein
MLLRSPRIRDNRPASVASRRHFGKMPWIRRFVCVVALAGLATAYELSSQSPPAQEPSRNPDKPLLMPDANRPPDANAQMALHDQQAKNKNVDAANIERKRQITDDSARLLKLASDLKAEVDKTSKDTLSLGVIRKAEEIEKLAHNVKEKMKLTMAAN